MRENVVQSRTVYPSKLLVKCEDKVMSFSDMKSLEGREITYFSQSTQFIENY